MTENEITISIDVKYKDITAEFAITLFSINMLGKIRVMLRNKPSDTKTKEIIIKEGIE
jgi:hypothetical protein